MLRQDKKNHRVVKLSKQGALRDRKARKLSKKQIEIIESTTVESKGKFEIKLKMNWHFSQGQFAKFMFTHVEVIEIFGYFTEL